MYPGPQPARMQGFQHHNRMELNSANNPSEPAAVLPKNLCVRGQAATPWISASWDLEQINLKAPRGALRLSELQNCEMIHLLFSTPWLWSSVTEAIRKECTAEYTSRITGSKGICI